MNDAITRLFILVCVLFAVLIGFTSRWTVFGAERLRDNTVNKRAQIQELKIHRGLIRATDNTVLARSVLLKNKTYVRRYPGGPLYGHIVGFSDSLYGHEGLEQHYDDDLSGRSDDVSTVFKQLTGEKREGNDLITTIDPKAQKVAAQGLAGRKGAVVAIEPSTGRIRAMVANPPFDASGLDPQHGPQNEFNRALQAGYPPGSTMKVVTAAAAIDTGKFSPDSRLSGRDGKLIGGVPLHNFHGEQFGDITLTDALTHSVNTVYGEVGEKLGKGVMADYMKRFGFYAKPPLDFPDTQMSSSGERNPKTGKLYSPRSKFIDVGRMAIGQDKLTVTPLQMAEVAATVANGGVRMKPRLGERIVDPDGRTVRKIDPESAGRVMSADTAAKLTAMMKQVVKEGTGTAAALQGVEVAGKTGTAELDVSKNVDQPWFIGFTGNMAVAVTVDNVVNGQGGEVAAPIAKQVLEALG